MTTETPETGSQNAVDESNRPSRGDVPATPELPAMGKTGVTKDATPESESSDPPAAEPAAEEKPETRSSRRQRGDGEKYRQRLRDTEAERDALRERLEHRDMADVERTVQSKLLDPKDLWAGGVQLSDLVDEDGEIDPERVDAAVASVIAQHPHWAVASRFSPAAPASSVTSDGNPTDTNTVSFIDAFRPPTA